jgi:HEAT repeat protein
MSEFDQETEPRTSLEGEGQAEAESPFEGFEDSGLRRFLGLFVVPLLVVVASVLVFIGFGWIAYESNEVSDYLNDMRSGWRPRRAQAAYELSKILIADPDALDAEPGVKAEVRRLFKEAEDEEMRRYLALVLGYTQDPQSVPLLVDALDDEDSQIRIYALWALGALGDERAEEPLVASLADPDPGIRKTAAYALGELGHRERAGALEPLLGDPIADVRWNAALSLARLGSDASVEVLRRMVDRRLLDQVPDITAEQKEEVMISAVAALAAVEGEAALETLAGLEKDDKSLKVRQAAIDARKAIASGAGSGSTEG